MTKGDIIPFGIYKWVVLDSKGDRILIITESIIEIHWYHNAFSDITWADCELRNYLNNEFTIHSIKLKRKE